MNGIFLFLSLLPSAAGVSTFQDAESARKSVEVAIEATDQMPASARQMAIRSLLKSVEVVDATPAYNETLVTETFTKIETMLEDLLNTFYMNETNTDQATMDALKADCTPCETLHMEHAAQREETLANATIEFQTCLSEHADLLHTQKTTCHAVVTFWNNHHVSFHCNLDDSALNQWNEFPGDDMARKQLIDGIATGLANEQLMTAVKNYLTGGEAYWSHEVTKYDQTIDDCTTATTEEKAKNTDCEQKNDVYVHAFCEDHEIKLCICTWRQYCIDTAKTALDNMWAIVKPRSDHRVKLAIGIDHVICVVKELLNGTEFSQDYLAKCPLKDESHPDISKYATTREECTDYVPHCNVSGPVPGMSNFDQSGNLGTNDNGTDWNTVFSSWQYSHAYEFNDTHKCPFVNEAGEVDSAECAPTGDHLI